MSQNKSISYDLVAIKSKIKQQLMFLGVLLTLIMLLLVVKSIYINVNYNKYIGKENDNLGKIAEKQPIKKIELNKDYQKGTIYGNSQTNKEQIPSMIGELNNRKSQLAFFDDIVFINYKEKDKNILKIINESTNETLFKAEDNYPSRELNALDSYFVFIKETNVGDKIMSIDKSMKNILDITPSVLINGSKISSLFTDGNNLFFTDSFNLYKSSLSGENTEVLTNISENSRIVNIIDNKIFIDDKYTLSSFNLESKKVDIELVHNEAQQVLFNNGKIFINENQRGLIDYIKNVKSGFISSSFSVLDNNIIFSDENKIFQGKNEIFDNKSTISNIYVTNKNVYIYDTEGHVSKISKK